MQLACGHKSLNNWPLLTFVLFVELMAVKYQQLQCLAELSKDTFFSSEKIQRPEDEYNVRAGQIIKGIH